MTWKQQLLLSYISILTVLRPVGLCLIPHHNWPPNWRSFLTHLPDPHVHLHCHTNLCSSHVARLSMTPHYLRTLSSPLASRPFIIGLHLLSLHSSTLTLCLPAVLQTSHVLFQLNAFECFSISPSLPFPRSCIWPRLSSNVTIFMMLELTFIGIASY